MKLTAITKEEVYKEAYVDYWMDCRDKGLLALPQSEWMETEEAKQSIRRWFFLLGMNSDSTLPNKFKSKISNWKWVNGELVEGEK